MTYLQKYLTLFLLKFLIGTIANKDCKINLDFRTAKYQPFILDETTHQIIYPKESRILTMGHGESIILDCHGFNFSSSYSPLISICHDEKTNLQNKYRKIKHILSLYNYDANEFAIFKVYPSQNNRNTLFGNNSIIVDGKEIPIIDESRSGTNYFAKGHLSPDAAFIYSVEQDGTYFYSNVAPQFQSFNNRNWKSIESTARKWASDNKRNLEVYTGTASILNLLNEQCKPINIELFSDRQYVPAPMYYWKVLYDPEANEAIAFIGLNNPYERKAHNHICTNICAQTVFDDVDFYKFEAGYTMCCEVSQLRMSISSIPDLSKEGKWPELMGKLGPTPPPPTRNGCKILLDKLPEKNTPLITSNGSFLYPTYIKDEARITLVPQGSTVELNCHRSRGNFLLYKEERISKIKSVKLTCTNDKLYTEGMEVNPADYKWIDKRKTDLERITHISLGWNFRSGYIEQVEICIDELFYGTLWTKHYVEGQNIEMRDKYSGHLSPDSAFVYDGEQEGTYFFVNVAPQYQSFNKGNWLALEYAVRDLAKNQYSKLTVYTGTYEILELHQKQIFLLEKKFIPVPRYFWKMNPQHNIPVLNYKDIITNESRAIAGYLASEFDKSVKLYPTCPCSSNDNVFLLYPKMRNNVDVPAEKFNKLKEVLEWTNDIVKKTGFVAGKTTDLQTEMVRLLQHLPAVKLSGRCSRMEFVKHEGNTQKMRKSETFNYEFVNCLFSTSNHTQGNG
ncbi:unnamed protein product [Lepeophtheirus salmonis]|uniref:(salmon louse) hypothetical protein n=1 Tax=Lepeophtheirus salmonis TaxID=72036 RepID=A0A7R8D5N2_LEPSM|nr:unnamed protein product [Lepeophtheirus salmonis]CAF2981210.1 unnamed protein product [Lepeophtheirus salmonis]